MQNILLSPLFALAVFLVLAYGLYRLGGKLAARGEDHPGKHQPYACGEDLGLSQVKLTYHAFFRLALMFGILHLATLVIATLPASGTSRRSATLYLLGIGISVLVLTDGEL
jgi:NADH:ubiquinone oxidoreductase subunit 3 (subunit A)